jgi:dihydrofolate reductase
MIVLSIGVDEKRRKNMRKIIVSEFVTLDGVIEAPDQWTSFQWGRSKDQETFKVDELSACDMLLLGRATYQEFAAFWPTTSGAGAYGDRMNSLPKSVVSTTLSEVEWNASLIKDNLAQAIWRIKQEGERDVLIFGSGDLVHTLQQQNLIDEYRLVIYPVVVGSGKRLFRDGSEHMSLKPVEARSFSSGTVLLRYQPDKN